MHSYLVARASHSSVAVCPKLTKACGQARLCVVCLGLSAVAPLCRTSRRLDDWQL